MTQLGDNLKEDKGRKYTGVGVTRIVGSSEMGEIKGYSMSTLPLEVMDVPGRSKSEKESWQLELERVKKKLKEKDTSIEALKAKLEEEKLSAHDAGYQKGKGEGLEQGEARSKQAYETSLNDLQKKFVAFINDLSSEKAQLFLNFEKEALFLIMKCVRKVFGETVKSHADAILPVVRRALDAMAKTQFITVKVNPKDFKTVDDSRQEWLPLSRKIEGINVEADERIEKASCLIDSDSTSVEMKLSEIIAAMEGELEAVFEKKADRLKEEGDV